MTKTNRVLLSIVVCVAFVLFLAAALNNNRSQLVRYDYEQDVFVMRKLSYIPDGYRHVSDTTDAANRSARSRYRGDQNYYIELRQQVQAVVIPDTGNVIVLTDGKYNYLIMTDDPGIDKGTLNKIVKGITPPLPNK